ncbi:MAG: putative Ig domain-containing protein [Planctomycetes bacterium]|nr:putative Ig domain-containing protein [Planctomycetota bacterium]
MSALLALALGLLASAAAAAPSVYQVEESSLGLTPLSGATALEPGSTSTCSSYEDYSIYYGYHSFTLPFTFYFFENTVSASSSRVWVNPNGFVTFTDTSSTGTPYTISSPNYMNKPEDLTGGTGVVDNTAYVMWDDLILMGSNPTPQTSYKVVGSAPNRVVVIEWANVKRKTQDYSTTCSYGGGGDMTAQLHVHEGSNILEFKYQDAAGGMDWGMGMSATIGLRGAMAQASKSVVIATNLTSAPTTNYTAKPQFYSEWDGSSSTSMTSSANWTYWNGTSSTTPITTSTSIASQRYMTYIPDLSAIGNKPYLSTTSNYNTSGLVIDSGGELTLNGTSSSATSSSFNLKETGSGRFDNQGTLYLTGSMKLRVAGDFLNAGTIDISGTNANHYVSFNGTSKFGIQNVTFGSATLGVVKVEDGMDVTYPTTVQFEDFNSNAFTQLTSDPGTFVQFNGDLDLGTLPPGAVNFAGGISIAATFTPATLTIPAAFPLGDLKLTSPDSSAPVVVTGDVNCSRVQLVGNGSFEFSGDVIASGPFGLQGTGSVLIGADPVSGGNLEFSTNTLFLPNITSFIVNGSITAANEPIDINISSPAAIVVQGGITAPDGFITLSSPMGVTVGGVVDGGRGVTVQDTPSLTFGPGAAAMNPLALRSLNGLVNFTGVNQITVLGDIESPGQVNLGAPMGVSVTGDIDVGTLNLSNIGAFTFGGDVEVGAYVSNSDSNVSIAGDFAIAGDVNDNATGNFTVAGQVVLKANASDYDISFMNRPLTAGNMIVRNGATVNLSGNASLTKTGLGNIAFEVEAGAVANLGAGMLFKLTGNAEGVVRTYGTINTVTGAGATRPAFEGGNTAGRRSRMIFAPGSTSNIDGLVLRNFGNSFATHAVYFDSGAVVTNFDNVSITGSNAAKAVVRVGTGTLPPTLNSFEVAGNSPANIDTEAVTGFTLSMTRGPNSGGNLYGAAFELDPGNVTVWQNDTPLAITTGAQLPNAQIGVPYTINLQTVGGNLPFDWSICLSKPSWMSIDFNTGRLFGTPTQGSTTGALTPFNVTVEDNSTPTTMVVIKTFRLTLDPAPGDPLQIETTSLPVGFEGVPYAASVLAIGGSQTGYNYTLASGTLPSGLSTAADFTTSGAITGTPDYGQAGDYSLGFVVTDSNGASSPIKFLTLTVAPGTPRPVFTTVNIPDAFLGVQYSFQLGATSGTSPYEFYVTDSNGIEVDQASQLPLGLQMTDTGLIYGTPTAAGPRSFYILVRDAFGVPSAEPLLFTLEVKQQDLGPISIDGLNSHGDPSGCALNTSSNWWFALLLVVPALAILRRRRQA